MFDCREWSTDLLVVIKVLIAKGHLISWD
uniref:Uncharacterized protein n=1 Tax=Arundo donax TaxID=35708 RepID=A0A0A8ZBX4_ARUDO